MVLQKSQEIFNGKPYPVRLTNGIGSKNVVVFLPGVSGAPFDPRFNFLSDAATESSFSFFCSDLWTSPEELGTKSISELVLVLRDIISFLEKKGFSRIVFVGKSFGGLMTLLMNDARVSGAVLISPTALVAESCSVPRLIDKKISDIKSILEITVNSQYLSMVRAPVLVVHGTADAVVPLENSQKLVSLLRRGELFLIEGADHSFKSTDHQSIVALRLKEFLSKIS